MAQLSKSVVSKSAANSEIVEEKHSKYISSTNGLDIKDIKELEAKLIELESEIQKKDSMLYTAASAGQQLVNENDNLHKKVKDITKLLKDKEDVLETYKKTNEMLKLTATRSGSEADELHKKLVESHKLIEQLREDNALLRSLNDRPTTMGHEQVSESTNNDINEIMNKLNKLQHEKNTLEEFLHCEQIKCSQFLQNAEINARKALHAENENQDLKLQIVQLQNENNELSHNTQDEIEKYSQTIQHLQSENEILHHQLNEHQKIVDVERRGNLRKSPLYRPISISDEGLGAELEELGYFESNERLLSTDNLEAESNDFSIQTPTKQFRKATVDAQEEFFRLTIIAAKIKFNDIPIATSTLWDKVKTENLSFHEVADWLNEYLTTERIKTAELQDKARRSRIKSITNNNIVTNNNDKQIGSNPSSPSKQFFRKIKNLADTVTNFSSTLRLEVRFGRRVFEVKMKKHDKLETLLQTLPRIIGEDAEMMEIFNGKRRLNAKLTLSDLNLNNNDILRMIHRKKVGSYLRRYEKKTNSISGGIEMDSEEVTQ